MTDQSAEPPFRIQRMSDEELTELARNSVTNLVFLTNKPEAIRDSWGLLWLAWMAEEDRDWLDDLGAIWEYISEAGPYGVNGSPTFFSAKFVHRADMESLINKIRRMYDALGLPQVGPAPSTT